MFPVPLSLPLVILLSITSQHNISYFSLKAQVMCIKDQLILDINYYFCNSILPLLQAHQAGENCLAEIVLYCTVPVRKAGTGTVLN
jgi:hypothetical protein